MVNTDIEPIFNNEEPFMNFNKFLYDFNWLFFNSTDKYSKNNIERPDRVSMLCDKLWENDIDMVKERAKVEIQKQIFTHNSNSDKLINWVESEGIKLKSKASDLIDGQWIERYFDQFKGQWIEKHFIDGYAHITAMPKFESFFNITSLMFEFFEWFSKMKKLNTVPTPSSPEPDTKKPKQLLSYKWESKPEIELPALYNKMGGAYIDMNTTLEQFTAIFTENPTESITPLKWIVSNRLLAYFLDSSFKGEHWASIAGNGKLFFSVENNKTLTANDLSKAKSEYLKYGLPKGYEKIDEILKAIKKHS